MGLSEQRETIKEQSSIIRELKDAVREAYIFIAREKEAHAASLDGLAEAMDVIGLTSQSYMYRNDASKMRKDAQDIRIATTKIK